MRAQRRAWILIGIAGGLVMMCAARMLIGSYALGLPEGDLDSTQTLAIMAARLHRLEIALIVGAALAISGVALQALLRNPLAEPYILGLSTGAAAGMMIQSWLMIEIGVAVEAGLGVRGLGALIGAGLSMGIVFLAGRRRGMIDPLGLLLTGVVLSTINGALVMAMNYMVGPGGIRDDLAEWMMGFLDTGTGSATLLLMAGLTAGGMVALLTQARAMDLASLSDAEAESLGVSVGGLRTLLFVIASVLAAGAVVLAGPIAFVGLICPHLARLMLGPGHFGVLIASAMLGGMLIVLADVASAAVALGLGLGLMPIGVFTALAGGLVFLWMLRSQMGRGYAA